MYSKKPQSILIVDDNSQNLQVLADILRNKKYKVATAKDGFKAIKFINKKKPDLVLLDIMMPELDGFEVCRQLKKNKETRGIPVIFISALSEISHKIKGFEAGGVDYITKPFQKEEIFARVNVHLALKHTQEELKAANATKDKLFSIIGHNLRGPIGALTNALDMITSDPDALDEKTKTIFLQDLQSSVKGAYNLLDNLLNWAVTQQNQIEYHPANIKINSLVNTNINMLSSIAKEKKINLNSKIKDDIYVYADENMTMIIMQNLISNALKFTRSSGYVVINAVLNHNIVEISVKDTGIGISKKQQYKLFHLEHHFSTHGTKNEKGCGLGLLLCKELVKKQGGKIWMESQENVGSIFTFTLPAGHSNNLKNLL